MRIKFILYKHMNDFKAIFECEHCGNIEEKWGYDDDNYHCNVVPNIICNKCTKIASKEDYKPVKLTQSGVHTLLTIMENY